MLSLPSVPRRVWTAVGALLLLAALTALVALPRPENRDASARQGNAPTKIVDSDIPWPREGQAAVALEGSGQVLTHGAQRPVPIASLTKVMTAYVVLTGHPLRPGEEGPRIEVDRQAAYEAGVGGESTVVVTPGDRRTERELLQLLLLPSANNIARLLARWDAGSEEAFVRKMQRAAQDLGMRDTTYTDASGIASATTSTAADQLKLAREAMRNPVLRDIVATRETTVPGAARWPTPTPSSARRASSASRPAPAPRRAATCCGRRRPTARTCCSGRCCTSVPTRHRQRA